MENVSRQVRRADERRQAKMDRAADNGHRYPAAKYRPEFADGTSYEPNGERETARRRRQTEGRVHG